MEARLDRVIRIVEGGAYIRVERMEAAAVPVRDDERGFSVRDDEW